MNIGVTLAERGWLPDSLIRVGVRKLLESRIRYERDRRASGEMDDESFLAMLDASPIAIRADKANEQHYEVPAPFFDLVLGPWRKYSCCLWTEGVDTLEQAEEAMLALTAERAQIADGMTILDLGCGWGSFSLWAARRFPSCEVMAVSNSKDQRASIEQRARQLGLNNVRVVTCDINDFDPERTFDRVVSIEMFEHTRNQRELLSRIRGWMNDDARLLVHVFCHKSYAYTFEEESSSWMGSEFFSGGMMPSDPLLSRFPDALRLQDQWRINGTHYAKTLRTWLNRLDARRDEARSILAGTYGEDQASRRLQMWRLFFLGCEESFAYRGGEEWYVSHYRFVKN